MTVLLALAGQAHAGKDTVADYLCGTYGFIKFAFSDALYFEVAQAFGVTEEFLRGEMKEVPSALLALAHCNDPEFVKVALPLVAGEYPDTFDKLDQMPLPPRRILQWWGTQYRRAQDDNYWIGRAQAFLQAVQSAPRYPEQAPQYFVECGTRFENEREWVHANGGNVWHIHRDSIDAPGQGHVSATPLPVLEGERELWNNDTIERLCRGVDWLLRSPVRFVRVEPMAPMVEPVEESPGTVEGEFIPAGEAIPTLEQCNNAIAGA